MTVRAFLPRGRAVAGRAALLLLSFAGVAWSVAAPRDAAGQVPIDTLTTVERSTRYMEWIGLDTDAGYRFRPFQQKGAVGDVFVPPAQLVAWGHPAEAGAGTYLVLVDGSVISIGQATSTPESIQVTTLKFGDRSFPLERVRGLVFRTPSSARRRDRLFESVESPAAGDRDRLTLLDGDELVGSLTSLSADGVVIETSLGSAEKQIADASTLVLNPALAAEVAPPRPGVLVGLRDGTLLVCSDLSLEADQAKFTPAIVWGTPGEKQPVWSVRREEIVYLQSIGGDARYLSDLEPTGYKHVPFFDQVIEYRADRSVTGGRLRAGGRRYVKGIAMPSTSRLTFPLDAAAKKFQAEIAIDDDAEGGGSVTFRVFVDAEERYRSEIVRGGDPPRPIEVDVAGGKQLSLVIDFAEFGDQLDHADWLNARLVP